MTGTDGKIHYDFVHDKGDIVAGKILLLVLTRADHGVVSVMIATAC